MKILAVDGNSILNRAFYGIRLLTTKSGEFTNGIYGFINILNRLIAQENPNGVCVAFDLREPTFRHKKYAGYKSGRKPMPPELASQVPLLKELLGAYGYTCLEKSGYEADDILGTVSKRCEESGDICAIATGDRDAFQLIGDGTYILLASASQGTPTLTKVDRSELFSRYGLEPRAMIDLKALQGDASDRIPGVPGVGEKTALDLVRRFGDIDYIYENLDTLDIKDGLRAKLASGKDSAYLSRELGTICRTVPIDTDFARIVSPQPDIPRLRGLLTRLEFFSLLEKEGLKPAETQNTQPEVFTVVSDFPADGDIYDILTTADGGLLVCSGRKVYAGTPGGDLHRLLPLLANDSVKKRVSDAKKIFRAGLENGVRIRGITFDTGLAGYLLNPLSSDYTASRLCAEYAVPAPAFENGGDSAHRDAAKFSLLADILTERIESENQIELLQKTEIPLAEVLADMEKTGFLIDKEGIISYGAELQNKIDDITSEIYEMTGYEFNLNSPKQLGEALFEKLKLPCGKKTKTGYSTSAEVLEEMRDEHPVIPLLLEYRHLSKLKSTYCDSLAAAADADGRIHSTLNQAETRTGRLSSTEPNLQNIPVRRPEGKELRRYFKAKQGFLLCDADYSQIELRILAHIADDRAMTAAFLDGEDIHAKTAAQVFNLPPQKVTPLMRSRAKAVNFGIVYGIGAFSLAKDIGVSRKEAAQYIDSYFKTYPGVRSYMERVVRQAKEDGYVATLFGRRRPLPELSSSNASVRAFGERVARNMPIQGTAADVIKMAMVRVYSRLRDEIPEAHLLMQVHDELIIEAPEDRAEDAARLLKEEMENTVSFSVPLTADVHIGKTWYEAKEG